MLSIRLLILLLMLVATLSRWARKSKEASPWRVCGDTKNDTGTGLLPIVTDQLDAGIYVDVDRWAALPPLRTNLILARFGRCFCVVLLVPDAGKSIRRIRVSIWRGQKFEPWKFYLGHVFTDVSQGKGGLHGCISDSLSPFQERKGLMAAHENEPRFAVL